MFKAYQALMLLLAQATEKELAAQVQYLKAETRSYAPSCRADFGSVPTNGNGW